MKTAMKVIMAQKKYEKYIEMSVSELTNVIN